MEGKKKHITFSEGYKHTSVIPDVKMDLLPALENLWGDRTKSLWEKNIFENKKFADTFLLYVKLHVVIFQICWQ